MKTIFKLIFLFLVVHSFSGFSQIKVYDDNRVKFFGDRPGDDYDNDLSMQIFGKYGDYLTNGKIGFGDYVSPSSNYPDFSVKMVTISELGDDIDSDMLELCGTEGLYLTWGQGYGYDNVIGKLDRKYQHINPYPSYPDIWIDRSSFDFNTDVYAHGYVINSDERFKENIEHLTQAYKKLLKLEPVSYNLKPDKAFQFPENFSPETEKEKKDLQELSVAKEKIKLLEKERFGFVAQDLQEVIPEVVAQGDDGLYVDYLGILPILVETIKEQQQQLTILRDILK